MVTQVRKCRTFVSIVVNKLHCIAHLNEGSSVWRLFRYSYLGIDGQPLERQLKR